MLLGYVAPEGETLLAAVRWIEQLLTGSIGTVVAIIAIASIGFAMLAGRLDVKRGLTMIFGCFILFGAQSLASALSNLALSSVPEPPVMTANKAPQYPMPSKNPENAYDPNAGASVPR
jgi:type IV secretory pathway VirB2 component (pilin)